jgi:transketolase
VPDLATRDGYGHALLELGESNPAVVVLESDLARSTRTEWFAARFPGRFFNMGIAEANMVAAAAGMAEAGLVPFATTYAIFVGRAFDQVRQAVAYSRANVKLVATHSGLSASHDGGSHQGLEDVALMRVLPGMTVISPADYHEARAAVLAAADIQGPVYIRLGKFPVPAVTQPGRAFRVGAAELLADGEDVAILATGALVASALRAAEELAAAGVSAAVANVSTLKPLDTELVLRLAERCGCLVTAEEHSRTGGLHTAVTELLAEERPTPVRAVAMEDCFGETGEWHQLLRRYGLSPAGIVSAAQRVLAGKGRPVRA